jgi:hypothetical protein
MEVVEGKLSIEKIDAIALLRLVENMELDRKFLLYC